MPLPSYLSDRLEVSRITQSPMIVYDTVGSPVGFNTTTIDLDNGYSYTFERHDQSRAPFNIGDRNYSKEEWEYLLNFFYDKRGRAIAFRYKDWGDYQASNQTLGIGDGLKTTFYFTKLYGDYQKDISQLVNGTVKLRVNGVLTTSGFTIYYDVGIVVFNTAIADDAIVTADFEFDLRVRFDSDSLSSRFEALSGDRYIVNVGSILIVETLIGDRTAFTWACNKGVCSPSPNGIYDTQSECEDALIPAGFSGGQSVGVYYSVYITYDLFNTSFWTYGITELRNGYGAITDIKKIGGNSVSVDQPLQIKISFADVVRYVGTTNYNFPDSYLVITNILIVRFDGLPDTGGDRAASCPI